MNVFSLLRRKRIEQVHVPHETLWTRTNRYHRKASGSVEGSAKTAVPRAGWGRRRDAAPTDLKESQ